jgi:toxin ParE1/3/4
MRIRWTAPAADDLAQIVEYIRKDNPAAARRVARSIYQEIAQLRKFPNVGRVGLAMNTRELTFAPWPYVAVYEIIKDDIQVLRIRHAAQDWA